MAVGLRHRREGAESYKQGVKEKWKVGWVENSLDFSLREKSRRAKSEMFLTQAKM